MTPIVNAFRLDVTGSAVSAVSQNQPLEAGTSSQDLVLFKVS
jgi:hypothetical protein